ncbi:MAG TPA: glutathione S-transferase C-terminal domain-containing protein [Candidatus Corynebacterium gallistercoris]|uniref:Glutathione S-transferase C-terminal domain-containing protein n=1 Tax=Candidatus Corynebacterium gallistercoris TaxID=2838530 RepID=A0A9D1UQH0_9CORY|nr:glutathione S-transferase C-terminal domain-containing protein [Candidatus Corynebacterium gallistercoris]
MAYVASGEFNRDMNYIDDRVTRDSETWPVHAGKYRLIAARACPWAHRAVITRRLLGLEGAISQGLTGPTHDWQSWTFDLYEDSVDPVLGIGKLRDAYMHRFPDYPKGITVPALVDVESKAVVTNDFRMLVQDFATEWTEHHREGAPDLYPAHQREDIDALAKHIFTYVNNGVYRAGFAGTQEAYEEAFNGLFSVLDELEERLANRRYLLGDSITFADVFLYPTLIRFDMVYHNHFKCNRNKITEMPNLWGYLRDLFQTPGFGDTTNFQQIKDHYYLVHQDINPTGVVPVGPDPAIFRTEHGRERLGGSPFGDGTAPGPIPQIDTVPGDERL